MTDPLVMRLDAALAIRDDHGFLEAVGNLDSRYHQVDFTQHPAPLCWFASLFHLYWTTKGQGIARYLSLDSDLDVALTLDSARRLGAESTVRYLEAAAALYPRKRVPVNDRKRFTVIERLSTRARDTGTSIAFTTIDERFTDALPSLASDVRRWIVQHRPELDEMLRRVPPPAGPVPSELTLEDLQPAMDRISAYVQEHQRRIIAPLREAAEARGAVPHPSTIVAPRAVRFYAAATQFGMPEWMIVAKRTLVAPRKFRSAKSLVSETLRLLKQSDLVLPEPFQQMLTANWTIRDPVVEIARTMPKQVVIDGEPIGLLAGANDAIISVSFALAIHDWLMLTPEGVKAARVLYGLFDGLAPCPELSGDVPFR